jgi:hypothetical protein
MRIAADEPKRSGSPMLPSFSCCPAKMRCAVGRPRRVSDSSITSSWISANVCMSSSAAKAGSTGSTGAPGPAEPRQPQYAKTGRSRLPPACTRSRAVRAKRPRAGSIESSDPIWAARKSASVPWIASISVCGEAPWRGIPLCRFPSSVSLATTSTVPLL